MHAAIFDAVNARVFGGIHSRRTCAQSNEVGRKIGKFALKDYLRRIDREREDNREGN